jgi:hypothetical protein
MQPAPFGVNLALPRRYARHFPACRPSRRRAVARGLEREPTAEEASVRAILLSPHCFNTNGEMWKAFDALANAARGHAHMAGSA